MPQTSIEIAEGPKIAALSCGKPVFLVVLLHGEGSDGASIVDTALNWAPTMPKADFLAAEAPYVGPDGRRSWLEPGAPPADAIRTAAALLDAFLDAALAARRLPDSHLALVGFSEGATLALHVAPRRAKAMAAAVAFSPVHLADAGLGGEVRSTPPLLIVHGDADPLTPWDALAAAREPLKAAGVPVKTLKRAGLGHQMDDDGVIVAGDFLTGLVVHKPAPKAADDHDHDHDHDHHDHAH